MLFTVWLSTMETIVLNSATIVNYRHVIRMCILCLTHNINLENCHLSYQEYICNNKRQSTWLYALSYGN